MAHHPSVHSRRLLLSPLSLLLQVATLLLALTCVAGCAHTTAPTTLTPEPLEQDEPFVSRCDGAAPHATAARAEPTPDPMRCDVEVPPHVEHPPPTTAAGCRALASEERAPCLAHVRAVAHVAPAMRRARAAQAEGDWSRALDEFEAAVEELEANGQEDAGVLGEAAWARFLAREWCLDTQDVEDLRYQETSTGEPSPVATLCLERAELGLAEAQLNQAVALDVSDERRAMLLYNLGRVLGESVNAQESAEYLRQSLCLRPNETVRERYAQVLWLAGDAQSQNDPDEARSLYRQSLSVLPSPQRTAALADIERMRLRRFQLEAVPRAEAVVYPDLQELCRAMLAPLLDEPLAPEDEVEGCDVDAWERIERDGEPTWSVGQLMVTNPEAFDGYTSTLYVVARIPAGVLVLLELGEDHGDSRRDNAFVGEFSLDALSQPARASLAVTWTAGEAFADGCDWGARAAARLALCGWEGLRPRCFAHAVLGPVPYTSESMLPTIQESLGRCDESDMQGSPRAPEGYAPLYVVETRAQELVITRERSPEDDDPAAATSECLPLREALCALDSRPATGCP